MQRKRIDELLGKLLAGTITKYEKNELDRLYIEIASHKSVYPHASDKTHDRVLKRLHASIKGPGQGKRVFNRRLVAVVSGLSFYVGLLYTIHKFESPKKNLQVANAAQQAILPGRETAILTLSNGQKIDLDSAANGVLIKQGRIKIHKDSKGQISYDQVNKLGDSKDSEVYVNSVATPKGGQYRLKLPDGTIVYLNAASSITYPTQFMGDQRIVELSGEAYFEVAKNPAQPFIVKTSKVNVKVLGTHFNVSAYPDESTIKTTLLEGAVTVNYGNQAISIYPGQQTFISAENELKVKSVSTDDVVAWKNGYFSFEMDGISSAMKKIARWYNVDVT
ncbi:MAG: FecR family protein, partial [Sphingobacteriaceae bacterium]